MAAYETFDPLDPASFYLKGNSDLAALADLTWVVDGLEMPVHSHIVSLASPVLCTAYALLRSQEAVTEGPPPAKRARLEGISGPALEGFSAQEVALFLRLAYHPEDATRNFAVSISSNLPAGCLPAVYRLAHKLDAGVVLSAGYNMLLWAGADSLPWEDLAARLQLAGDLELHGLLAQSMHCAARRLAGGPSKTVFQDVAQLAGLQRQTLVLLLGAVAGAQLSYWYSYGPPAQQTFSLLSVEAIAARATLLGSWADVCHSAASGRAAALQLTNSDLVSNSSSLSAFVEAARLATKMGRPALLLALATVAQAVGANSPAAVRNYVPRQTFFQHELGPQGTYCELTWPGLRVPAAPGGIQVSPQFQAGGRAWTLEFQLGYQPYADSHSCIHGNLLLVHAASLPCGSWLPAIVRVSMLPNRQSPRRGGATGSPQPLICTRDVLFSFEVWKQEIFHFNSVSLASYSLKVEFLF